MDGPRWFLRGVLTGRPATDPSGDAAEPLMSLFRNIVVVRGTEAMAPRDPIPLRLPDDPTLAQDGEDDEESDPLSPFQRGPEITEIH